MQPICALGSLVHTQAMQSMPPQRPLPRIAWIAVVALAALPLAAPAIEQTCRGCLDACCGKSHADQQGCGIECARAYARCLETNCIRCIQATYRRPWLHFIYPGIPGEGYQPRLPRGYGISGTKPVQLYPGQVIVIESADKTEKAKKTEHD